MSTKTLDKMVATAKRVAVAADSIEQEWMLFLHGDPVEGKTLSATAILCAQIRSLREAAFDLGERAREFAACNELETTND